MTELTQKRCLPCEAGVPKLTQEQIKNLLDKTPGWQLTTRKDEIYRDFIFENFYQTMAFANAIAWMAHTENHHPDMEIGYQHCKIRYSTHAIGGLSENDFICAAKVNTFIKAE